MKLRPPILVMLLVLGLAFSAGASNPSIGVNKVVVSLPLTAIDTADYVVGALANDTIPYYSVQWGFHNAFSEIDGRIYEDISDTCTAVAFSSDSVYFILQTKIDDSDDPSWYTVWKSALTACSAIDAAPVKISIPSDSLPSMGDIWRFVTYWVNEEDSMTSGATLFYGADSTMDPIQAFKATIFYRLK